jgi:RimJ/RimL family protein N-acetyltransferase
MQFAPRVLEDRFVRLEPHTAVLREELRRALDCDPPSWDFLTVSAQGRHFDAWWDQVRDEQARGEQIAFGVRRLSDGRLVGSTSFLNLQRAHRVAEIGATFLRPEARGTEVNPACKRLMLGFAFDQGAQRVEIVADGRNLHSQAAIAKLGAVREAVFRRHKIVWTGYIRDTVMYAITDLDWPAVRAGLDDRLTAAAGSETSRRSL